MTNKEYIEKWLEGTLNEGEEAVFKNTEDYKSLKRILNASMAFKAPPYNVEGELQLQRTKSSAKVVHLSWVKPLMKVAAALVVMSVGYLLFFHSPTSTIETIAGEMSGTFLPDSSQVILNADSRIDYRQRNWQDERELRLEGEAFFSVAKGSKFEVNTSSGTISVLGTQFNVKNRKGYFEVICYEGRVRVETGVDTILLDMNSGFRIVNGHSNTLQNTSSSEPAWMNDESEFQSVPFIQVLKELERQYDITVEFEATENEKAFTGGFTHKDLKLALKSITLPLNLTYDIVDSDHVILATSSD